MLLLVAGFYHWHVMSPGFLFAIAENPGVLERRLIPLSLPVSFAPWLLLIDDMPNKRSKS